MKTTLSAKLFRGVRFLFRTHVAEGFSGQCCFFLLFDVWQGVLWLSIMPGQFFAILSCGILR